jgi:pilus assembly protein Flp/PilA
MKSIAKSVVSFLREEDGVTAIEYGLIAALIAIVIIAALLLTGQSLNQVFTTIGNCLANPAAC